MPERVLHLLVDLVWNSLDGSLKFLGATGLYLIVEFDDEIADVWKPSLGLARKNGVFGAFDIHLEQVDAVETGDLHQLRQRVATQDRRVGLSCLGNCGNLKSPRQVGWVQDGDIDAFVKHSGPNRSDRGVTRRVFHQLAKIAKIGFDRENARFRISGREKETGTADVGSGIDDAAYVFGALWERAVTKQNNQFENREIGLVIAKR